MRLMIDTDTASDDAVALVMALRHPQAQVEAITVVTGNGPLEQVVQNALYTVELCGAAVPVYAGAAKPLMRPIQMAQARPWAGWHGRHWVAACGGRPPPATQ